MSPEMKQFRETSYHDFLQHLHRYGSMTKEQIATEMRRPGTTMFEMMFGNLVINAAKGEKDARRVLLERLWGKPKEDITLNLRDVATNDLIKMAQECMSELAEGAIDVEVTK